jgi:hypothetical protein
MDDAKRLQKVLSRAGIEVSPEEFQNLLEGREAIRREMGFLERLWVPIDQWRGSSQERLLVWRWRTKMNAKAMFGLLEDDGIPAGSWLDLPNSKPPSRQRLWMQLLAARLFGRKEG